MQTTQIPNASGCALATVSRPHNARKWRRVLVAVCALAVLAIVGGRPIGSMFWRMAAITASSSFILAALVSGACWTRYGRGVLVGLSFCWLGDLLGPVDFRLGASCFLIGHFGFVAAFMSQGLRPGRTAITGVIAVVAGMGLYAVFWPHLHHGHATLVVAYIVVISAMVTTAVGTRAARYTWMIPVAAVVFYVSDVFVARWAYLTRHDPWNVFLTYPLYYASCMMFALSVARVGQSDSRGTSA